MSVFSTKNKKKKKQSNFSCRYFCLFFLVFFFFLFFIVFFPSPSDCIVPLLVISYWKGKDCHLWRGWPPRRLQYYQYVVSAIRHHAAPRPNGNIALHFSMVRWVLSCCIKIWVSRVASILNQCRITSSWQRCSADRTVLAFLYPFPSPRCSCSLFLPHTMLIAKNRASVYKCKLVSTTCSPFAIELRIALSSLKSVNK